MSRATRLWPLLTATHRYDKSISTHGRGMGQIIEAPIYRRTGLGSGDRIAGPAILIQLDATILLLPGQTAEVHRLGALIVREG